VECFPLFLCESLPVLCDVGSKLLRSDYRPSLVTLPDMKSKLLCVFVSVVETRGRLRSVVNSRLMCFVRFIQS
jgi:hypothetical protein